MQHKEQHSLAGKTITIASGTYAGHEYRVEDWWDRIAGKSWMVCDGNPACLEFAIRTATEGTALSDEVVYGKIGGLGKLIHVSQLGDAMPAEAAE